MFIYLFIYLFIYFIYLFAGGVYTLEPLPPRWDPTLNSFSLPFYGRARLPSAKNFQMVLNTSASAKQQQQQEEHLLQQTKAVGAAD